MYKVVLIFVAERQSHSIWYFTKITFMMIYQHSINTPSRAMNRFIQNTQKHNTTNLTNICKIIDKTICSNIYAKRYHIENGGWLHDDSSSNFTSYMCEKNSNNYFPIRIKSNSDESMGIKDMNIVEGKFGFIFKENNNLKFFT